nr:hypothetical protein [Tanacetum cinerariifolium]
MVAPRLEAEGFGIENVKLLGGLELLIKLVEGWFESTFKKVAEKWGRVLETSNCNLDEADILVTENLEEDRYTLFAVEGNHHKDSSSEDDNGVPSALHEDDVQECSDSKKSSECEDYDDEGEEVEETQGCNPRDEKFSTNDPKINLNVDNIFQAEVDSGIPEQRLMEDAHEKVDDMSCREDIEVKESRKTDSVCI